MNPKEALTDPLPEEPTGKPEANESIPDFEGQNIGGQAAANPAPTTQTPVSPPPPPPPFGGHDSDRSEG